MQSPLENSDLTLLTLVRNGERVFVERAAVRGFPGRSRPYALGAIVNFFKGSG